MSFFEQIVPYTSVFIDASWTDFIKSIWWCTTLSDQNEKEIIKKLNNLFSNEFNKNSVLPCLSVRTGLDLFLKACGFLPSSEIIMSAINIPAMAKIVHAYGLEVVSFDVDIATMKPKISLLESLITSKTKAIILANIFGKGFDMNPYIKLARKHNLFVIEDWAEGFNGLDYFGNPDSDLSLFSFGPIKYYTAFGGAIAKIKDENLYNRMKNLYESYPKQSHMDYLRRVLKYSLVYVLLNCPRFIKPGMFITRKLGIDHKKRVIGLLRGFPEKLFINIRQRPCTALLQTLLMRLSSFNYGDFVLSKIKAEYALNKMPPGVEMVGYDAEVKNYWLFPVLVDNPEKTMKNLNNLGVDAYKGATQLNIILSDRKSRSFQHSSFSKQQMNKSAHNIGKEELSSLNHMVNVHVTCEKEDALNDGTMASSCERFKFRTQSHLECNNSPNKETFQQDYENSNENFSEAQYLIDHIIYLPINKTTPFNEIDKILSALTQAVFLSQNPKNDSYHVSSNASRKSEMNNYGFNRVFQSVDLDDVENRKSCVKSKL